MVANPRTDTLYAALAGATDLPPINLQRSRKLCDGRYAALFASVELNRHPYTAADFNAAIQKLTENAFNIVESSLYEVQGPKLHIPMYRCVLSANTKILPHEEVAKQGMKAVRANVFSDPSDNLWRLVGTDENRYIMQMSGENFDEILNSKRQRNPVAASFEQYVPTSDGDYVYFLNQASAEMDFGFIIHRTDGDFILSRASGKVLRILPDQIVESTLLENIGGQDGPAVWKVKVLAKGEFSPNSYLDYMRTLFGQTEMFKKLEDAIRKNGVV